MKLYVHVNGLIITNLVIWVVNLWWFPLSVHLIIPVVGFLGIWVRDVLRLVPVFWFFVIRVIDLLTLIPVIGLLGFRVLKKNK